MNTFGRSLFACTAALILMQACVEAESELPEAGEQIALVNSGFETIDDEGKPAGWADPGINRHGEYSVTASDDSPHGGNTCAALSSSKATRNNFGILRQTLDLAPYRGHRLRLSAMLRVVGGKSMGRLWLNYTDADGKTLWQDNMSDRPITRSRWTRGEILFEVPEEGVKAYFGGMLSGAGTVLFDDFLLEDLGLVNLVSVPARPLTDQGLENLVALARLHGALRYFHPSDEAASANWEQLTMQGVAAVEECASADALGERLLDLFLPVAPTLSVYSESEPTPPLHEDLLVEGKANPFLQHWVHKGLGLSLNEKNFYSSELKVSRMKKLDHQRPDEPEILALGQNLIARVPLTLIEKRGKTQPVATREAEDFLNRDPGFEPRGSDRITHLADVILLWNVFQHFYPYFEEVEVDWDSELRSALRSAAMDDEPLAFLSTLRRLVAATRDGHGSVGHDFEIFNHSLPLRWAWVEERLVVTTTATELKAPKPGDIVVEINGEPVHEVLARIEAEVPAPTKEYQRQCALWRLPLGLENSSVDLTFLDADEQADSISLTRELPSWGPGSLRESLPDRISELEPGYWYVDLDRITKNEFDNALESLETAKGIIFDLRGYPDNLRMGRFLGHLTLKKIDSPQWLTPCPSRPNRVDMNYQQSSWSVKPRKPYLEAKCVFITGPRAISAAETILAIVKYHGLADILGGTSAGTNGNINPFTLPGGYEVRWTGLGVRFQDGSHFHGIGVKPDLPVTRTILGVREGRDELLEAAIAHVKE
jgi:hypothetical protein